MIKAELDDCHCPQLGRGNYGLGQHGGITALTMGIGQDKKNMENGTISKASAGQ